MIDMGERQERVQRRVNRRRDAVAAGVLRRRHLAEIASA